MNKRSSGKTSKHSSQALATNVTKRQAHRGLGIRFVQDMPHCSQFDNCVCRRSFQESRYSMTILPIARVRDAAGRTPKRCTTLYSSRFALKLCQSTLYPLARPQLKQSNAWSCLPGDALSDCPAPAGHSCLARWPSWHLLANQDLPACLAHTSPACWTYASTWLGSACTLVFVRSSHSRS